MYSGNVITHHMLEHGVPASCGVSVGGVTLDEAIADACKTQEDIPEYDGRGPKSVGISFNNVHGAEFEHYGDWTAHVSLTCKLYFVEAFNVGRMYHGWGLLP